MNKPIAEKYRQTFFINAIESNLFEYFLYQGKITNSKLYSGNEVSWTFSGGKVLNRIFDAQLNSDSLKENLSQIMQPFQTSKTPVAWLITPNNQPANLVKNLEKFDFEKQDYWIGMALELRRLKTVEFGAGLEIKAVTDNYTLNLWLDVANNAFHFPPSIKSAYSKVIQAMGTQPNGCWRLYIGWLNGVPVATCALFFGTNSVGVYWTTTKPELRKQGLAMAVTYYALKKAKAEGWQTAVLHSTRAGLSTYQQLGFQSYCPIDIYTWKPRNFVTRLLKKAVKFKVVTKYVRRF